MQVSVELARRELWDTIIVGAGAVGIVLAVTLARSGRKVLLLESGSDVPSGRLQALNEAEVVGRRHQGIADGRARVVGGTTTLWGGQLTSFTATDFDSRREDGTKRWPIEFATLARWYGEAARLTGLDEALVDDARVDALSGHSRLRRGDAEAVYTRWLREPNFATFFKTDLDGHDGLCLLPSAHARCLLAADGGASVAGVRVANAAGEVFELHGRRVVLASGTIEISRLLLLTARAAPQPAWAENPNIGACFQDHLDFEIGRVASGDFKTLLGQFENFTILGSKVQPKLRITDRLVAAESLLNAAASLRFDSRYADDLALLKTVVRSVMRGEGLRRVSIRKLLGLAMHVRMVLPIAWNYLRHRRITAFTDGGVSFIAHFEQAPVHESRISLSRSKTDAFGDPIAVLDWRIDEAAQLRSLRRFAEVIAAVMREEFALSFARSPSLDDDAAALAAGRDSYHQCGGAIMSGSAADGVVDADCRVHGCANLYVAGAAVFPSSGYANPTFTAMALAIRLAHSLASSTHE